ncbi:MAG: alpha/beta hydrolase, partial [Chloroflexi bacterium]|nr:alpha/beta hydrolase [Chloroflexota bacterium]
LYAIRYPEELKGLILMGTGARLRVHPDLLERCREPGPDNSDWLAGHMKNYKHVAPDMHPVLTQRAVEVGPEVELNDLLACDRFDVMDQLGGINLPTKVLCGSNDAMTPVKYADYLTEHLPNAEETVIPGGHFVQMEEYKKVNEEIESFMASLKKPLTLS